jgi:serine/threonine protein kinase
MKKYTIEDKEFILPEKYEIDKVLGSGAYSNVILAKDTVTNEYVAIKKNTGVFEKENVKLENELLQIRILRELIILNHFNHENIIGLKDVVLPESIDDLTDVYLVLEFMETNLKQIITSKQLLTKEHIQW